jgi:16S rRNA (uracil1498-N3)-methyltransferase
VEAVGRGSVELRILERLHVERELDAARLVLAVALPKGDRARWLIEKSVELGVDSLVPLSTRRQSLPVTDGLIERLRRTVIEASKQCGRNRLMQIAEPVEWRSFVAASPLGGARSWRLLADPAPGTEALAQVLVELTESLRDQPGSRPLVCVAVGPEGGFTADELELAREHAWRPIGLGPRTLRIETAAIAVAAAISLALAQRPSGSTAPD